MDGETNAVDGGLDVQRPPDGCSADDHIIERMMGRPPGWHPRLEHRPLLNPAAPFQNIAQAVEEFTGTHFREEAEPAHINAENGHGMGHDRTRGAQHGAVTTEADEEVSTGCLLGNSAVVPVRRLPDVATFRAEDRLHAIGELNSNAPAGVQEDADLLQPPPPTSYRSQKKNSRLPSAPSIGEAVKSSMRKLLETHQAAKRPISVA